MEKEIVKPSYLYYCDISDFDDGLIDKYLKHFDKETADKIASYKQNINKKQTLTGYLLLRAALKDLEVDVNILTIERNGKPYVKGLKYKFNITHSDNLVAVAVSEDEIGVDVEKIKPANKKLVERYFSTEEQALLNGKMDEEYDRVFFEIWTKKESLLKKDGIGITLPLSSFSVTDKLKDGYKFTTYNLGEYILTVCHKGDIKITENTAL